LVAGLQYKDQRDTESFNDNVKHAVFQLFDGRQTAERSAHATDFYAFPLIVFYGATDFDEIEYQAEATKFWAKYESVDVGVTSVEIVDRSDESGYVHVTVDATVSRILKDGPCREQTADSTYLLTLQHLDVGYRIRSERESAIPLKCP
jgi:hypothetical protein